MPTAKHIKAVAMGGKTCVGVSPSGGFPLERGNCFDVEGEDGRHYRIVNFVAENLSHLTQKGLAWPIHIAVLYPSEANEGITRGLAAINDPRIGDRWYSDRWCEVCCPASLLPIPQILAHRRQEARGERRTHPGTSFVAWSKVGAHKPQFP